jgi:hypothetical protein
LHPFHAKVNYQAIGSGGGIAQIKSKTVNFGAADDSLSDYQGSRNLSDPAPDGLDRTGCFLFDDRPVRDTQPTVKQPSTHRNLQPEY